MELKLLANTELRKKFHYIRRLRKAASHANQLEELCYADTCDARTKLEAQVWNSLFRSTHVFLCPRYCFTVLKLRTLSSQLLV